jgi:gliding motility-associated-like protein
VLQNPNTGCQTRNEAILNVTVDCNIQPEICDDGIDNDMNGLIDCADQACAFFPLCEIDTSVISQVYIANALSTNSSINGRLTITPERDQVLRIEDFEVYDRWGNQIHRVENMNTDDPEHAWNGTFSGRPVRSGVYFYRVLLTSGSERLSLSGDVTVIN